MTRKKATNEAIANPAPPKTVRIGFLPKTAPFHKKVVNCFAKAEFNRIRVWINRDYSMVTFGLELGTHPPFASKRQAYTTFLYLAQDLGFQLRRDDICLSLAGNSIEGAFVLSPNVARPLRRFQTLMASSWLV